MAKDITGQFSRACLAALRKSGDTTARAPWLFRSTGAKYRILDREDGSEIGIAFKRRGKWIARVGKIEASGFETRDDAGRWAWQKAAE